MKEATKAFVPLSQAARMMGVGRATAYRRLRRHSVKMLRHGEPRWMVPIARVYRYLASNAVEEIPMLPEILELQQELDATQKALERLAKWSAKAAMKLGIPV